MQSPPDHSWRMLPLVLVVLVGLSAGTASLWRSGGAATPALTATQPSESTPPARPAARESGQREGRRYLPTGYAAALWPLTGMLGPKPFLEIDNEGDLVLSNYYFDGALCALAEIEHRDLLGDDVCVPESPDRTVQDRISEYLKGSLDGLAAIGRGTAYFVRQQAAEQNVSVEFLVATLPDYVDSSGAWFFDTLLDPITRAAADAGFSYLGHFLPESLGARTTRSTLVSDFVDGLSHEDTPGAVVFRAVDDCKSGEEVRASGGCAPGERLRTRVLVVLVVTETATAGIHLAALEEALDLVELWHPSTREPVRILGPTFTGSIPSLRTGIENHLAKHPEAAGDRLDRIRRGRERIGVVSGSATGTANASRIRMVESIDGQAVPVVTYTSTTRTDREILNELVSMLKTINPRWATGEGVAILHEATAWGESARKDFGLNDAMFISFPMHISRLRAADVRRPEESQQRVTAATHLRLKDEREDRDRIPSMTPEMTAGMVDSVLEQIFRTLQRSGVTAVGLLATDKRDHLFLAQEMARRAPDVFVFALEGNLLYLHPDASAFLRGTLVSSSYPLFGRTQHGTRRLRLFAAVGGQGEYNAASLLLQEPYDGASLPSEKAGLLTDHYGPRESARPGVWLSVVGRDAFWPISASTSAPIVPPTGYLTAWRSRALAFAGSALSVGALLAAVVFVALVPSRVARSRRSLRWLRRFRPPVRSCTGEADAGRQEYLELRAMQLAHEYRVTLFAAIAAVVVLAVWLGQIVFVLLEDAGAPAWVRTVSSPARDAALLALVPLATWAFGTGLWQLGLRRRAQGPAVSGHAVAWLRLVPLAIGAAALWSFRAFLADDHWTGSSGRFHVERTMALESLVSPAVPIVLLCTSLFWWAAWNLRRVYLASAPYDCRSGIITLLHHRAWPHGWDVRDVLNNPILRVGNDAQACGLLALAVLAPFVFVWNTGVTVDGSSFGGFLWWGTLCLLTILAHTLANALYTGRAVLALLRSLSRHGLAEAFSDVKDEPLHWHLSFRALKPGDTEPLFRRLQAFAREMDLALVRRSSPGNGKISPPERYLGRNRRAPESALMAPWQDADRRAAHHLGVRADDVAAVRRALEQHREGAERAAVAVQRQGTDTKAPDDQYFCERRQLVNRTVAWRVTSDLSAGLIAWLERRYWSWPERLRSSGDLEPVHREAQRLVGIQAAIVIRDVLTRLVSSFTVVIGGLLFVIGAHLLYTFQGRRTWLVLDWIYLGVAAAIIVWLLVQLEKTVVLQRLWGAQPGRINWSGGFGYRIAVYAAVPLITLFATVFPELGGSLVSWLEPVRKALP